MTEKKETEAEAAESSESGSFLGGYDKKKIRPEAAEPSQEEGKKEKDQKK